MGKGRGTVQELNTPVEWLGEHEVENDKHGLPLTLVETVMSIPGIEAVDPYLETVGEVS
jgi:hypothetical protein